MSKNILIQGAREGCLQNIDGEFFVYMICSSCGHRMRKLIGGYFSFNTREGACPACQGLGKTLAINKEMVINETQSLDWDLDKPLQHFPAGKDNG